MKRYLAYLIYMLVAVTTMAQDIELDKILYSGFVETGIGAAYNYTTDKRMSSLNWQPVWIISSSHGAKYKGLFGGIGVGYNFTQRDKENMYLMYADLRYTFVKVKTIPSLGIKTGFIYDPYWISEFQKYGALTSSIEVLGKLRIGVEASGFCRPSRHYTANATFVVSYTLGNNYNACSNFKK